MYFNEIGTVAGLNVFFYLKSAKSRVLVSIAKEHVGC